MESAPAALVTTVDTNQAQLLNQQQHAEIIQYLDEIKSALISVPSNTNSNAPSLMSMLQKVCKYVDGVQGASERAE